MPRQSVFRRRKMRVHPSTGMADIGLMLLITVMCVSEMHTEDVGIVQRLQSWFGDNLRGLPPDELSEKYIIDINNRNQLMADADRIDFQDLRDHCSTYVHDRLNSKTKASRYVIILVRVNRSATYERYIQVLNEVVKVRNNYFNNLSQSYFNKNYDSLGIAQKRKVLFNNPIVILDKGYEYYRYCWRDSKEIQ